ncbi:hypothetical protein IE53DRAFT_395262 [Violaceomyces palustris]|uniref:Uncharacterized protein n=1 Tax=Violaceomyces palustris TaxID=1673888 RepID=A0ACD0NXH9_9BASI|nr:hypothetical protein IE53DRAFT_395262 [Violaceomyces palustris]
MTFNNNNLPEDAIAVVGISCRAPGASSPEQLWQNILAKKDLQSKMPSDRFNVDAFYHPNGLNKGTTNAVYGYFLEQNLRSFDAPFFNLSRKEAEVMDPQHRLSLELVYEALEDASMSLDTVAGTNTSVLVGAFTNDYGTVTNRDLVDYGQYTATGNTACLQSNRISFFYDLHGVSLTLDTACSSSLVGFHIGCETIRSGQSDMSIVVGSALHYDPSFFISVTDLGMLSADGRCRAWDEKGSGYVRGEGICVAVLKNAHAAIRDGDPIRAIVRGTGSNHDGKKQGITMPNPRAQEQLIRDTFRRANLDFSAIQYFEAHGTGTRAGDPRETSAIGAVFASGRDEPLVIGSVKTNIGHLEGASGLAGLIKVIKSLEHKAIAPNMHFEDPNPAVLFDEWKLRVPTVQEPWPQPKSGGPRMACINSFGFGGANAHAIVQEPPLLVKEAPIGTAADVDTERPLPQLLLISGQSEASARSNAAALADYLEAKTDAATGECSVSIKSLALTLNTRRTSFRYRAFIIASDAPQAIHELRNLANSGAAWTSTTIAPTSKAAKSRVGFVFTGQGAQHETMGRQLIHTSPLFRQVLERFDQVLQNEIDPAIRPGWSVVSELLKNAPESRIRETEFSQPICTAIQLALVEQLKAWGLTPGAVVGHSSGEVAAAYAAGILSFRDACIVAFLRGYYMGSQSVSKDSTLPKGGMMAVGLTESEARKHLETFSGRLTIACVNSAKSMTLAGDLDALQELKVSLDEQKIFARLLQVAQAFHSHHMVPLSTGYLASLEKHNVTPRPATVAMFSSVTARRADWRKMGPAYWVSNMVSCVQFEPALVGTMLDDEENVVLDYLVEVGPHPALKGPCKQVLSAQRCEVPYIATLSRGLPDHEALLSTLGHLWSQGASVGDLTNATCVTELVPGSELAFRVQGLGQRLCELPTYRWDHEGSYWFETRATRNHRLRKYRHNLLGYPLETSIETIPRWRNLLRISELPWLEDHKIQDRIIFPASGYIALAVEGATKHWTHELQRPAPTRFDISDVSINSALELSATEPREVMLEMRMVDGVRGFKFDFSVFSFVDEPDQLRATCHEHCTGTITLQVAELQGLRIKAAENGLQGQASPYDNTESVSAYYDRIRSIGLQYGPTFQLLRGQVESGSGQSQGTLSTAGLADLMAHEMDTCQVHPALLDASFHVLFCAVESQQGKPLSQSFIPTHISSISFSSHLLGVVKERMPIRVRSTCDLKGSRNMLADIQLFAESTPTTISEEPLLSVCGVQCTAVGGPSPNPRSLLFRVRQAPALNLLDSGSAARLPSQYRSLAGLVDLVAHQCSPRILALIDRSEDLEAILSTLGSLASQRRRFSKLDVLATAKPDSWSDALRAGIETEYDYLVDFVEEASETYDLIVDATADRSQVDRLPSLISESGYVFRHGKADYEELGTLQMRFELSDEQISCWGPAQGSETSGFQPNQPVAVVLPSDPSAKCQAILVALTERIGDSLVQRHTLESIGSAKNPSLVISLASLDEALLGAPGTAKDEKQFKMLQKNIFIPGRNVVWLLPGANIQAPSPRQSIVMGMARSARNEVLDLRFVSFDCPTQEGYSASSIAAEAIRLLDPNIKEEEVVLGSDGVPLVPRVIAEDNLNSRLPNGAGRVVRNGSLVGQHEQKSLQFQTPGRWDSMVWGPSSAKDLPPLEDDEVQIRVKSVAVSPQEAIAALELNESYDMGEVAFGEVVDAARNAAASGLKKGDTVLALVPYGGALSVFARTVSGLCLKADSCSAQALATLKLATLTVFACRELARVRQGDGVLVQADDVFSTTSVLSVIRRLGAEPLLLAEDDEQAASLIQSTGLEAERVLIASDPSIAQRVQRLTGGSGLSLVMARSALPFNLIKALSPFTKVVFSEKVGQTTFLPSNSVHVSLGNLFQQGPKLLSKCLREARELVEVDLEVEEITAAGISLALKRFHNSPRGALGNNARHPVVAHLDAEDSLVPILPPLYLGTEALFDESKLYLLVGGLGGLGRSLAAWLIRRGARRLCFLSRSGQSRPEAKATVDWLKQRSDRVEISVIKADVSDYDQTLRSLKTISSDLKGIFHAATLLRDVPLEKMSYRQWTDVLCAKAIGGENLHRATQSLGIDLDHFVCFSSAAAQIGGRAQANYSAANTYLDALVQHRKALNLAATSIDAGMIVGVGLVAEDKALQAIMERAGFDPVREDEMLFQVEVAVRESRKQSHTSRGVELHSTISGINLSSDDYFWCTGSRHKTLYANIDGGENRGGSGSSKKLSATLRELDGTEERTAALLSAFLEKLSGVFGLEPSKLDPSSPLSQYGLDSLVAVELRNWFASVAEVDLALFDVLGSSSILALVTKGAGLITTSTAAEGGALAIKGGAVKDSVASEDNAANVSLVPIKRTHVNLDDEIPMSLCQRRIWTLSNLVSDPAKLNLLIVSRLRGSPSAEIMRESLKELQRRNWILRSAYYEGEETSVQRVNREPRDVLAVSDLSTLAEDRREEELDKLMQADRFKILDIEEGETFRCRLVKLSDKDHVFGLCVHHIACDAGSTASFISQLSAIYDCISVGGDLATVAEPKVQYGDYCQWEREFLDSVEMQPHLTYWRERLRGASPASELLPMATRRERPEVQSELRDVVYSRLSKTKANRMKKVADRAGVTQFHFFLAALRTFVYRYTGQRDVTYLMVNGTRPHNDVADSFGLFLNLSPIRCDQDLEGCTFAQVMEGVKQACVDAIEHGITPWEAVLKEAQIKPSRRHFPLSQMAVNYQIYGRFPEHAFHDFKVVGVMPDDMAQPVDMNFEAVLESEDGLALRLEYNADLYADKGAMQVFLDNFAVFLDDVSRDHRQPIDEIRTCSEAELEYQKKTMWNTLTEVSDPFQARTVVEQILSFASARPDQIALSSDDGRGPLTYAELKRKAVALSQRLRASGKVGGNVALISLPSVGLVISMLAAHLSGNGFVVLDPTFAKERLSVMLTDSGSHSIIVDQVGEERDIQAKVQATVDDHASHLSAVIRLDLDELGSAASAVRPPSAASLSPQDPFYMIYTSGSTGVPKGVQLSQENTRAMLTAMQRRHKFSTQDVFLNQTTGSFDISMVQIFSALTAGGRVAIPSPATRADPSLLADFIVKHGVTCTFSTPTQFAHLLNGAGEALLRPAARSMAKIFFGGERLPASLVRQLYAKFPGAEVINTWSPSEVVVQTTTGVVPTNVQADADVLIGRPIDNCRHYICDPELRPVAVGMAGEICVGGPQVGRYLNRPEANARSFPENPFAASEDAGRGWTRLFRTGDRGRFTRTGELAFEGRINGDLQVKLRGYRIDLGEIETLLSRVQGENGPVLKQVAVRARVMTHGPGEPNESGADQRSLVAFIVPAEVCADANQKRRLAMLLNDQLSPKVNGYMLPTCYHLLEHLPVTAGGKLYRSGLDQIEIEPVFPARDGDAEGQEAAAVPLGMQSEAIARSLGDVRGEVTQLFRKILRLKENVELTPSSNFFDLGGNSILLVALQHKLQRKFNVKIKLATLFAKPRPENIAANILRASLGEAAIDEVVGSASPTSSNGVLEATGSASQGLIDYEAEISQVEAPTFKVIQSTTTVTATTAATPPSVLLIGAETYIGLHMLETIMGDTYNNFDKVYLLGVSEPNSLEQIISLARDYKLSIGQASRLGEMARRVSVISGSLSAPSLGLSPIGLEILATQVGEIYHCGTQVSLMKNYDELRPANVRGTLDVIELATKASNLNGLDRPIPIHYLSSWSTLLLQRWNDSVLNEDRQGALLRTEPGAPNFFRPDASQENGYFKTRWVSENILDRAAAVGGHDVTIYRPPAAISSRRTGVPEPETDYIRSLVADMVRVACVPEVDEANVIDLVPVDYITESICALAVQHRKDEVKGKKAEARYEHLCNPSPLSFRDLAAMLPVINPGAAAANSSAESILPLSDWHDKVEEQQSGVDKAATLLKHSVSRTYIEKGHTFFQLDSSATLEKVRALGVRLPEPVDIDLIRQLVQPQPAVGAV